MRTFRYFWKHVQNYKLDLFLIIFGISFASIALYILAPYIISLFIDALTNYSTHPTPENKQAPFIIILFLLGTEFLNNAGFRIAGFVNSKFQPAIMRDIEQDCLEIYHKQSMNFFGKEFVGSLVSKANRLVSGFEDIADLLYWDFLVTLITLGTFLTILFFKFPLIAIFFLVWCLFFMAFSIWFSLWKLKYDKEVAKLESKVTASFADSLTNYSQVKTFSGQKHEANLFALISQQKYLKRRHNWCLSEYMYSIQGILTMLFMAGSLYLCAQFFFKGLITLGEITFIQLVFWNLLHSLWELGRQTKDFAENLANCDEMIEILEQTPSIGDKPKTTPCRIKEGHIEMKQITFGYDENTPLFNDFNLSLKPGEKVGLVGKSGGGKSTLTKLLLRFEEIHSGEILIDGQNIQDLKQNDLRSHISFVPQDTSLFHRSLKENIGYGNPKASNKDIESVAKKAKAHPFIIKTAEGYKTQVGERGVKLSGGERQRIAIARSMLKRAPILILDEATSALDSESEKSIQTALHEIMKGKTTLAIAHRLSTLREMDRIIVLDEGSIIEMGSHEELLQKKNAYADLWSHQVRGFISD